MEELANELLEKTGKTKERYEKLNEMVSDPDVIADNREWKKLVKERSSIEDIVFAHDRLEKIVKDLEDKNVIDKNIIGGFKVSYEDYEYDASVVSTLKRLHSVFEENLFVKGIENKAPLVD